MGITTPTSDTRSEPTTQLDPAPGSAGNILVVDDMEDNRLVLREGLIDHGYEVIEASSGAEALRLIHDDPPDVILLDLMMPEMDGFEVCERVRATGRAAHVPIIMVTALSDREKRIRGIEAGANDFVTKPVDLVDLQLRVRNAVHLSRLYEDAKQRYLQVARLEQLRDRIVHMVAHDVRAPLTSIHLGTEVVLMDEGDRLSTEAREDLQLVVEMARAANLMIDTMLAVSRIEANEMPVKPAEHDVGALAHEVARMMRAQGTVNVSVEGEGSVTAFIDRELTCRMLSNLLSNALRHSGFDPVVEVRVATQGSNVHVAVTDSGPGIPANLQERIFDHFFQAGDSGAHKGGGAGLGLSFCRMAAEAQDGRVGVISELGNGSTFWFELPTGAQTG
jgi:signal transduction histidine kinase